MSLPINKTICFPQDTAERKRWFRAASFSHPAKMILGLQIYLIEHYTKVGETICDPMAGSGTVLVGCALGRNVICVELEKKFCDMQEANWQKIKSLGPMLGYKMGRAQIMQGDARNMAIPLFHPPIDKIVTSPPYAGAKQVLDQKFYAKALKDLEGRDVASENAGLRNGEDNPDNISSLLYGEISAVISLPPYGNPRDKNGQAEQEYEDKRLGKNDKAHGRTAFRGRYADAAITSPPYEAAVTGDNGIDWTKLKGERDRTIEPAFDRYAMDNFSYSKQKTNIGNLKSDNYLSAMLSVYQNCHRVLKDGGLLCLVTKNFIRDKKLVRLDLDTIKLCEKSGFVLIEQLKRKLTSQSFWRIIYKKKYPEAPEINYEDVLIFARLKET